MKFPRKPGEFADLNILHIFNDGFIVSLALLLPFIQTDLNLNLTQVGFLGSILHLLSIALALPAGIIAAKYGGLRSLIAAVFLYSLGYFLTAASPNYLFLTIAFFIAGSGFGIFHPIAFATVANLSAKNNRGRAMGNFTAVGDLGRVAISAAITALATYIGWRLTSGIYGGVALGIFVIFSLLSKNIGSEIIQQKKQAVSLKYLLKHKSFLLVSLTAALDSFASSSLFVFIPFLLLSKGMNPATLGAFTGFFFIGNFLGKSMLGRFVDRFGNFRVFAVAELLMAINIVLFTLSTNWIFTIIIAVMLGALSKGTVPVIQTMLAEVTEKDQSYEKVFALNAFTTSIATTAAPLLFGIVADSFGISHVFTLSAVFAILAIGSAYLVEKITIPFS